MVSLSALTISAGFPTAASAGCGASQLSAAGRTVTLEGLICYGGDRSIFLDVHCTKYRWKRVGNRLQKVEVASYKQGAYHLSGGQKYTFRCASGYNASYEAETSRSIAGPLRPRTY